MLPICTFRKIILNSFLLFLLLLWAPSLFAQQNTQKPNVLFLFADDQRADALGAAGNPYIHTPTLDQLAREGSRFENAYVMGGNHGAVCAASRAMLLSGKSLFHVYDKLKGENTMPMDFARAGYSTFGTGKWHNEKEAFEASFQQAKNVYLGGMADHYHILLRDYDQQGKLGEGSYKGYSTEIFAQGTIDFIENHVASGSDQPFFAYVAFTAPHDPYSPEAGYINHYPDGSLPLPGNFMAYHPFQFDNLTVRDEHLTGWPRKPEVIQMILSDYYALVTHLDNQIGKIIQTLKDNGLYDNTIIVYAADNGLAAGSHGLLGKQSLYEHSTKVPVIIKGPGIPQDKTFDAMVYLYDLYPTLSELAGLPKPAQVDGKSLAPILQEKETEVRSSLFTAYRYTVRAVRTPEWKLIRYPERDYTQLYHLANDPLELNNLAENKSYTDTKDKLMTLLADWQKNSGDTAALTTKVIRQMEYDPDTLVRRVDRWQPEYTLERYFKGVPKP